MFRPSRKLLVSFPENWVPLSDINAYGTPNRQMIFFQMKLMVAFAVILARASASTHLVKYSTATMRNLHCLVAVGKGPTMSIPHKSNGHALEIGICLFAGVLIYLLWYWHC